MTNEEIVNPQLEIVNTIKVLRKEVEVLTKRIKPAGTGYLHTTIDVLNNRIDELIEEGMFGKSSSRLLKERYGRAVETVL